MLNEEEGEPEVESEEEEELSAKQPLLLDVCQSFDHSRGLVSHHLRSFDRFCELELPPLLQPLELEAEVRPDGLAKFVRFRFSNVSLHKPSVECSPEKLAVLFPAEARLRNLTYAARILADFHLQVYALNGDEEQLVEERPKERVLVGEMPVMVKSKLCNVDEEEAGKRPFDVGGYFIVKGAEKVLVAQETSSVPGMWIPQGKSWKACYSSSTPTATSSSSNSSSSSRRNYVSIELTPAEGFKAIWLEIPGINPLPIVIAFRALGVVTDKHLLQVTAQDLDDLELSAIIRQAMWQADYCMVQWLTDSKQDGASSSKEAALSFIADHIKSKDVWSDNVPAALAKLETHFMPHLGPGNTRKILILGYMVRCLCLSYLGRRPRSDLDSFKSKRLALAGGDSLRVTFRSVVSQFKKELSKRMEKRLKAGIDAYAPEVLDKSSMSTRLQSAFSTGNWAKTQVSTSGNSKASNADRAADLLRANPMATISHLRQVRREAAFVGQLVSARLPNPSHNGRICPAETPDGENCGLVKSLAVFAIVSTLPPGTDQHILEVLSDCQMLSLEDVPLEQLNRWNKVLLNGTWVGVTDEPEELLGTLRNLRRSGEIHSEVEISWLRDQKEICILTDDGRVMRPLLIVQNGRLILSKRHKSKLDSVSTTERFSYLLNAGVVELLGPEEESTCIVAVSLRELESDPTQFTHLELHPASIMGVAALMIPFLNHNQSSRVTHQAQKHGRQAMGFYTLCPRSRMDKSSRELFYPQKPIARTLATELYDRPEQNCVMAATELQNCAVAGRTLATEMTSGQNCVVAVLCYKGYNQEDSIILNETSIDRGLFRSRHVSSYKAELDGKADEKFARTDRTVESDGFPVIGDYLHKGLVLIGKTSSKGDTSVKLKATEEGKVEAVMYTTNANGAPLVQVQLSQCRRPKCGDKFSSMHGQKGVIGCTLRQEDMPFTQQGITPDVIINPHAFPTRQTLGQLLESCFGKACAAGGCRNPSERTTAFSERPITEIGELLHGLGFQKMGMERLYNGETGKMMDGLTSMGVIFYQRLNHMAEDKIKCRSRSGPVQALNRQPVTDRKRLGGVGFGEMERDCLLAHGACATLQERLFTLSDPCQRDVCSQCGRLADTRSGKSLCRFCRSGSSIVLLNIPYSCILLQAELASMCIDLRFMVA